MLQLRHGLPNLGSHCVRWACKHGLPFDNVRHKSMESWVENHQHESPLSLVQHGLWQLLPIMIHSSDSDVIYSLHFQVKPNWENGAFKLNEKKKNKKKNKNNNNNNNKTVVVRRLETK